MRNPSTLNTLLPLLQYVNATIPTDLTSLTASISSATNVLDLSLNETGALNTSAMLRNIGYGMGASLANLGCANSTNPTTNATTIVRSIIEPFYLDYTTSISDLSASLTARGRATHAEPDLDVNRNLQALTRVIYNYGKCLRNGNYISEKAAIDTWNAGGDIMDAEVAWATWDDDDLTATTTNTTNTHAMRRNAAVGRKDQKRRKDSVRVTRVRRNGGLVVV